MTQCGQLWSSCAASTAPPSSSTRRSGGSSSTASCLPHRKRRCACSRAVMQAPKTSTSRFRKRSEEHTSELQSHHDLVCRLLLEKKNSKDTQRDPACGEIPPQAPPKA